MDNPLQVLIVDDSPDDTALLVRELDNAGYETVHQRVADQQALAGALVRQRWDLVLCDFTMSGFGGTQALSFVRGRGLDVPFIFVSGTLDDATAAAAMRAGAQDYVPKANLKRLIPAIERELGEAELRRAHARAEAGRLEAEARFREILDMAPDAIVAVDSGQRITVFNRAAETLFGYDAREVAGKPLDLLLPSELSAGHREHVARFARGPVTARRMNERGEVFGRRKCGDTFAAEASISRVGNAGAETFMAIVRDVTQQRLLEEQLRQAQKMEAVGQLTGGLAHDFNNLLTVNIGNLELLQEELEGNARGQELARQALETSLRGAELTRQLLAFSRRQSLEPRALDLNALTQGTVELLSHTLGEQIEIEMSLAADLRPVLADPTQLDSALVNLAINARDAMARGGRLIIETANRRLEASAGAEVKPGDYVMLAVSDNGGGMPPELLDKAFDPFFTTKEQGKGTGLGLSMVYGFTKQSGGHVEILSEVGEGTTVRLFLPRAQDASSPAKVEPTAYSEVEPSEATVLVVEDEPAVRKVTVGLLAALGYRVLEASSGRAALELLAQPSPVDLLFTDVVLHGGLSGPDLAREVRRIRPGLKVLFTSGYAESALDPGNDLGQHVGLLRKPYRKTDLAGKLRQVLSCAPNER